MTHDDGTLPFLDMNDPDERHAASPTAHLLAELALYGHRPGEDEPDPRPLPEPDTACRQLEAAVEALELDRFDLGAVLLGLGAALRLLVAVELGLDAVDLAVEEVDERPEEIGEIVLEARAGHHRLERLTDEGKSLIERRNAFEFFRDHAAELFESATGSAWRPLAGSMVNRRALTAAMIDSRQFIAARRRADAAVLAPSGPRIAFTGGADCNDHRRIWDALDKVHAKHSDMVLLHGGSPRGAERIAACWADNRKVPQVVFKPDWTRHRNAAPFKRNDRMLEALPIGVVFFPGSGIAANLAEKARKFGIPVWRFTEGAA